MGGRQLILVRHGRTAWNVQGRFQGQADPPLDRAGRREAWRVGSDLRGFAPAAVVSSDLRRARQTASRIAAWAGVGVSIDAGWREQALGGWEGLTEDEAAVAFPDEYGAWKAGLGPSRGGGESEQELADRVTAALERAAARCPSGRAVIVVSHGLALQAALARRLGPDDAPHLGNGRWLALSVEDVNR
jgi:broad specificity phosphatase PhoE